MKEPTGNTIAPAGSLAAPSTNNKILWTIFLLSVLGGGLLIFYHASRTPTYTIDSYFYLSKARQLVAGHGLTTSWNDGLDPKYFPGYSLALAAAYALGGSFIHLQIIAYVLSAVLLVAVLRELRTDAIGQILAATALAVNPITLKWFSLPMAEGVALALSLASVLMLLGFSRTGRLALLISACLLGGIATVTRVEALFLLFVFALILYPNRHTIRKAVLAGGLLLFFLPLLAYLARLSFSAGGGPAYAREFWWTMARFSILKNFLYNVWVPFGLMYKTPPATLGGIPHAVVLSAAAIWLLVGQVLFLGGLSVALLTRKNTAARAAGLLFLAYAVLHALWYYRYERFMLLALPLAALIWAWSCSNAAGLAGQKAMRRLVPGMQVLLVAAGLSLGHVYSTAHSQLLQQDAGRLQFPKIATAVNKLNANATAVLTDLGPHLAYYLDAHSYMDDNHGNYWHRAFPPEQTASELNRLGIGFVVTRRGFDQWMTEHYISPDDALHFTKIPDAGEGVTIIKYRP